MIIPNALASREVSGFAVVGAAGVGKSRLAHEFVARLDRRTCLVRLVSVSAVTSGVTFGALASFVPVSPTPVPSQSVLVTAVAAGLAEAPEGKRAVVVVDDAHLLDQGSVAALLHLLRERSAFVLMVARAGEPGTARLSPLWTEGLVERIDLPALSRQETEKVLWQALDGQVAALTVQRLYELTRGNALLLRELVISGISAEALVRVNDVWAWNGPWLVAPRLTELVQARLGDLDEDDLWVLELVALSEPVGLGVVSRLVTEDVLVSLERRGLLWVQQDGRRAQLRIAHPLYAEALRDGCPPLRSRLAKRRLSEALAATGARRRNDVLQIAQWRLDAGVPITADVLIKAAQRAWALLNLPLAERLAREALSAAFPEGRKDLLMAAATVLWRTLISGERHAELLALIDAISPHITDPGQRARGTFARAETEFWGMGDYPAAMRSLSRVEGVEGVGRWVSEECVTLRAVLDALAGNLVAASTAVGSQVVREMVQPESVAKARVAIEIVVTYGGADLAGAELVAETAGPVPVAEGIPWVGPVIALLQVQRELLTGELDRAAELAHQAHQAALPAGWEFALMLASLANAQVARCAGRIDEAGRWLRAAGALHNPRAAIGRVFHGLLDGERAYVAAMTGDHQSAATALAAVEEHRWVAGRVFTFWADLAGPWVKAARGAAPAARTDAIGAAERLRDAGAHVLEALARADAVRLGSRDQLDRLRQLADANAVPPHVRLAGTVAGNAPAELEAVAAELERSGWLPPAIEAYARAAHGYAGQGHADAARRCRALLSSLSGRCPGLYLAMAVSDDFTLTAREHEVARLALSGMTNRQIAEDVGIAKRTVDNHLARVYAKLGISTRGELRRFLES